MNETVLIVEDNKLSPRLTRDLLIEKGYRTVQTPSGKDAAWLAMRHRPDLLVVDFHLADMRGSELIRTFAGHARLSTIPVLLLSAFHSVVDEDWLLQHGCDAFVAKPLAPRPFIEEVVRLLSGVKSRQHRVHRRLAASMVEHRL